MPNLNIFFLLPLFFRFSSWGGGVWLLTITPDGIYNCLDAFSSGILKKYKLYTKNYFFSQMKAFYTVEKYLTDI